VFGGLGRDLIVGGADNDMLDGGEHDDMIFGDQIFLNRRVVETGNTDIYTADITSGRFQVLCGTLLYSRTDRPNACGGSVNADNSGALLTDGLAQNFRDADSPGIDDYPWWAEYGVNFNDGDATHHYHDFVSDSAAADAPGANAWGNDYIAGGANNDLIFGQLGADTLQGDAGIYTAWARLVDDARVLVHASASRTPDGCTGTAGINLVCDVTGDIDTVPSAEAATDGEDYIEGNAGNDLIFGDLGQDDIVGGSSSFFSLTTAEQRPDGADVIFGGAGDRSGRNDDTTASQLPGTITNLHARDADTIAGDNANIVRIVGTNGTPIANGAGLPKFLSFNYDNYDTTAATYGADKKIAVRGVTLIDYTPGGPDFRPDRFPTGLTPCTQSGGVSAACSALLNVLPGRNRWTSTDPLGNVHDEIGGNDEIHGDSGDDAIYGQVGHDVLFGDAQDDDIIGGWGNDWISGGTGQDGVIGDDGRIFTSRNTACPGAASSTVCSALSEPLYGIFAFRTVDPDTRTSQGDVLNEFIYTPGMVQTAYINVPGALAKAVDISPFDLSPSALNLGDQPLFDANNSDDVIFGGWDDDFLHGAAGDDAIMGGEALANSYVQLYPSTPCEQQVNCATGLIRTDWTRPYNSGDMLRFGADTNPWHANQRMAPRLGEFLLYDEYDPRRTILFKENGSVWTCLGYSNSGHTCTNTGGTAPTERQYFINFDVNDATGRITALGCIQFLPNGTCVAFDTKKNDGYDAIFGDLGNDWLVGGTGKDTLWAGWGNDVSNGDDDLTTNFNLNDLPDTHFSFEDRAYAGAGIDILIGNTGGDRLIDWVGEFNSYIVPFAPFGIATVSRQNNPQLPEFLYALSRSQGADPTRATDTGNSPVRNGEPDGELGLIRQQDPPHLWQTQTGGPTDPQAGNIPGGRRDVLRSADFNDGSLSSFAIDSGTFSIEGGALSVTATSNSGDAVAVFYQDAYLPVYYEVQATVSTAKPIAGWKANSYVVFDYFSPTDFKFAGIDVSINKMVIGHRTASGWAVDAQSPYTGSIVADNNYSLLIQVNGTMVWVNAGNKSFSYNFAPRVIEGELYGLNKGLVGVGSDQSRGRLDNMAIQIVQPTNTIDRTEDYNDGIANLAGASTGTWTVSGGRQTATPTTTGSDAIATQAIDLGNTTSFRPDSYVELTTNVKTAAAGGLYFDSYALNDFKFAMVDVIGQRIVIGHVDPRRGYVVDQAIARTLSATTDYVLSLSIKGASVAVTLSGAYITTFGFNSPVVDGGFGLIAKGGTSSFDNTRIRTDDPVFNVASNIVMATGTASGASKPPADEATLPGLLDQAKAYWSGQLSIPLSSLADVRIAVADLPGQELAMTVGRTIYIDRDGAGRGWTSATLLDMIKFELGHILGRN
jgi:Ca2+-binding RTX toxin-like protein